MKALALTLLLSASMLWAQSTTPQTPPAGAHQHSGAGTAQAPQHQPGAMMGQHQMGGDMGQHMQTMLDQMKGRLDRMRTALGKVQDPAAKEALQADYDLWNTMFSHMQQMQGMMSEHMQGMGMSHPATAKPSQSKPATTKPGTATPPSTPPPQY